MAYDIPSISDLEAIQLLNKHYAEVVTSKKDGIASGSDITQTTNPITGVTRRTLYKILDDMDDTFLERLLKMAFTPVGTFTEGATLTDARQILLWEVSEGGDGHYYSWSGTFPKAVAAGSSPSPIAAGSWVDRTDVTLRSDINVVVKRFASVADMVADTSLQVGQVVETISYYDGWAGLSSSPKGGNLYEVVAAGTGIADGGSFINTSSGLQLKGLFATDNINLYQFGFTGDSESGGIINSAVSYAASVQRELIFPDGEIINIALVDGVGIHVPSYSRINGNNSTIKINNSNLQTYEIVKFGDFNKHIRINDLYVEGDVETNTQTSGEWGMGFQFHSNDDVILKNCGAKKCWGDGVYLGVVSGVAETNGTIILDNFNADDNRRQGLSIISCRNLIVIGGNYDNTGKTKYTAPGCGIDIEPNAKDVCDINATFIGVNTKGNKRQGLLLSLQNAGDPDYLIDGKDFVEINVSFENCKSLFDGGLQSYISAIRVVGVGDKGVPTQKIKGSITFDNQTILNPKYIPIEFVNSGYIPDIVINNISVTDAMDSIVVGEDLGTSSVIQVTQRGEALTIADYDYSNIVINGLNYLDTRGDTYSASNNATDGYHRIKRPVWFYDGVSAVTPFPRNWITINDFRTNIEPQSGVFSNVGNVFNSNGVKPNYTINGSLTTYVGYSTNVDLVCVDTGSLQTIYLPDSVSFPQYVGETIHYYSNNQVGYLRFIPHGTDVMVDRDGTLKSGSPYIYQRPYPQGDYYFKCISPGVWMIL